MDTLLILFDHLGQYPGDDSDGNILVDLTDDWPRDTNDARRTISGTIPCLYIPATRVSLPGVHILNQTTSKEENKSPPSAPLKDLFDTADAGVFYGQYVEQAMGLVRDIMYPRSPLGIQARKALEIGYLCAKRICSEVIQDDAPHHYIEEVPYPDATSDTIRAVHFGMGIVTSDDITGEPLYAGALSSGTQGTLLWVWALALKMVWYYKFEEGWEEKPAILLIDEIENHLHPTWQRRVIPALLEHFPKLQIFATTHSPFVVAGLKAGQVHLLKRDEKGTITASTNERDVIGWTADEILRTMMGVDEPTDQLTVDRAKRLRELRGKETLSPEEESELNELRRQVNKDLLSKGGPLEAEREHYADLMREFLRSQQSELAQDGG